MVKRVVVGAHYGLRDWLAQRITACVIAVYAVLFIAMLLATRPNNYFDWRGMFASQWMKLATLLFFLSIFLHAWIGMRDILMDYVKPTAVRLALEVAVILSLVAWAMWSIKILWSV